MTNRTGADPTPSRVALARPLLNAVAALVVIGVFWQPAIVDAPAPWSAVVGIVSASVAAAAMLARWRFPELSAAAAGVATIVASVLGVCQDPMLAAAWCLYPVALARSARARVLAFLVGAVLAVAMTTGIPGVGTDSTVQRLVIAAAALGAAWLSGVAVGRQIDTALEVERARAREQATRVQLDVARDVHDVVGHALGVIGAEAGVTRGLPDADEQELRDALGDIEGHARTALEEIQALVRSLRSGPDRGALLVAPDADGALTRLPSLIAATRAAGVAVDARIMVHDSVDEVVGMVATRIVQEALGNVVRHAPGAACTVELEQDGAEVVVRVRDDGPGAPEAATGGFGLAGMRERARLVGGTVTWRNRPDRGFDVEARLPSGGRP
ncbi:MULTISPECIES: sensor histidine kinase [Actinoalloteichus]|uniref:histidine kinase n=1 Tax=Actinoalloteichus fjordicus TaxID=1612552 RepID=A0AAC9LF62_9PSEU|nr:MULTISPECIES: sensor histidine kinase [Actinoalloteichus]APU15104.1 signal transduction histidine kinase [Actinoalloteichus fjordicus]APU21172.1 signal transduction histidine kinase [Actinoalloteichus sp. GBA129-24]